MTDALRDAAQHALDVLEQVTRHFTRTPSTLADSTTRGNAHAAMRELRAAIAAPPGWVLVPVEPTIAMQQAALDASRAEKRLLPNCAELWASALVYGAMLAAAPGAPDAQKGAP